MHASSIAFNIGRDAGVSGSLGRRCLHIRTLPDSRASFVTIDSSCDMRANTLIVRFAYARHLVVPADDACEKRYEAREMNEQIMGGLVEVVSVERDSTTMDEKTGFRLKSS